MLKHKELRNVQLFKYANAINYANEQLYTPTGPRPTVIF